MTMEVDPFTSTVLDKLEKIAEQDWPGMDIPTLGRMTDCASTLLEAMEAAGLFAIGLHGRVRVFYSFDGSWTREVADNIGAGFMARPGSYALDELKNKWITEYGTEEKLDAR